MVCLGGLTEAEASVYMHAASSDALRLRRRLRDASPTLRTSALLALCKLMCLDAAFCDTNLQLIFTLLHNR